MTTPLMPFRAAPHFFTRQLRCASWAWPLLLFLLSSLPAWGEVEQLYYPGKRLKARIHTTISPTRGVQRHGLFERYHPSGKLQVQGRYDHDQPTGLWRWWNPQGLLLREIHYREDGPRQTYGRDEQAAQSFTTPGGHVAARGILKGKKGHGPWRYWYPSGALKAQGRFINGVLDGPWHTYYEDGQIKSSIGYQLGLQHGPYLLAYPGGQEKMKGGMEQGMKTGLWRFWYPSGLRQAEGNYYNDREDGLWRFWDKKGQLLRTARYAGGTLKKVLPTAPPPPPQRAPQKVIPLSQQQALYLPRLIDPQQRRILSDKATPTQTGR